MYRRILLILLACLPAFWLLACCWTSQLPSAQAADQPAVQTTFARDGVAFLARHCIACHNPKKKKADLVLEVYKDEAGLLKDRKKWQTILGVLESGEMPPQTRPRPPLAEVEAFT